ncbi:unnamed protein product [marine sediment metagenome]|uniref:Uncharacterized protein n=1 Tax=marine sediment metagenome TaxID=412755 RepID=X1TI55_9ZZZZ
MGSGIDLCTKKSSALRCEGLKLASFGDTHMTELSVPYSIRGHSASYSKRGHSASYSKRGRSASYSKRGRYD